MNISIVEGDITGVRVDAIVNAANSGLLGGGGVDGAIHAAGGPEILAACRQLRDTTLPAGLPPGQAVATTAGRLPATWVIHTVGPVYSTREDRRATLLQAYTSCLHVADELGAHSVAAHAEVGRRAAELGVGQLFAVGKMAPVMAQAARDAGLARVVEFAEVEGALSAVKNMLKAGDVVLLKASRSSRLERIAETLKAEKN